MSNFFRSISLVVAVMAVMACAADRQEPIYNVNANPISASGKGLSAEKVGSLITQTALAQKWVVDRTKSGALRCTLKWREHVAVVDVTYTGKNYSINHVSTSNLLEENGQVHRKYNERIRQLQNEIDHAMSMALNK